MNSIDRIINNLIKNEVILRLPKSTINLYTKYDEDFINTFLTSDDQPLSYFYVSHYLGKMLKLEGEPTLEVEHCTIWGDVKFGLKLEDYPSFIRIAQKMNAIIH